MGNALRKTIFIALPVLILVLVAIVVLWQVFDVPILDSARAFQAIFAVVAITSGAIFAYYKFEIFRDFEPHLTITQKVSHRLISDNYVHIEATATLHNSSKVAVEIREAFFRLQQISPFSDEEIEMIYAETLMPEQSDYIQWITLEEYERYWLPNHLIIEPGELHSETYEFIVSKELSTVLIYAYFHNSEYSTDDQASQGWATTSVHDIVIERKKGL